MFYQTPEKIKKIKIINQLTTYGLIIIVILCIMIMGLPE